MFNDNYCGVYRITVQPTGHFYIGSAANMPSRREQHLKALRQAGHHNLLLQRLFDAHGEASLEFSVIELCETRQKAYETEAEVMEEYAASDRMLNIGKHTRGGDNLSRHPNRLEVIARTSATLKKQVAALGPDGRQAKYGQPGEKNGMWRRAHTAAAKEKIRIQARGNRNSAGREMPQAQRERLAEQARQRTGSANGFFGRSHSAESRSRMGPALGTLPTSRRPLQIDGQNYTSIKRAMLALGLSRYVIKQRLADPAFSTYKETK